MMKTQNVSKADANEYRENRVQNSFFIAPTTKYEVKNIIKI